MPSEIGAAEQRSILRRLQTELLAGQELLLIGSTATIDQRVSRAATTKDVDVVLIFKDGRAIASKQAVDAYVSRLEGVVKRNPDDGSWVRVAFENNGKEVLVDIIRGKERDRPQGTFLPRNVLSQIAATALSRGTLLRPGLNDLIVMKASAVIDQERLQLQDPTNQDRHRLRAQAYRDDARAIAEEAIRKGKLDPARLDELLGLMREDRAEAVRTVLVAIGALEP